MPVWFVSEARFGLSGSGQPAPLEAANVDEAWQPYADQFDDFRLVCRIGDEVTELPPSKLTLVPAPYWSGIRSLIQQAPQVLRFFWNLTSSRGVYILRMPGTVSIIAAFILTMRRKQYFVELVGDIEGVATSHGSLASRAITPIATRFQRLVVRRSSGCRYVTQRFLQDLYPTSRNVTTTGYSDANLSPFRPIADERLRFQGSTSPTLRVLAIGSQETMHKGHDVLIEAVALLPDVHIQVTIIGKGRYHQRLRSGAAALGVSDRIRFIQQLPKAAIAEQLRQTDLFVMPSRSEGLGRAMLEAMATGLPCIGTSVGGLQELLSPESLVPPSDAHALAERLRDFAASPDLRTANGRRNVSFIDDYLQHRDHQQREWLTRLRSAERQS